MSIEVTAMSIEVTRKHVEVTRKSIEVTPKHVDVTPKADQGTQIKFRNRIASPHSSLGRGGRRASHATKMTACGEDS
jgi:hypothetical protein